MLFSCSNIQNYNAPSTGNEFQDLANKFEALRKKLNLLINTRVKDFEKEALEMFSNKLSEQEMSKHGKEFMERANAIVKDVL